MAQRQRRNGESWLVVWINEDGRATTETLEAGVCPCRHCWCGDFSQAVTVARAELAQVFNNAMASTSGLEAHQPLPGLSVATSTSTKSLNPARASGSFSTTTSDTNDILNRPRIHDTSISEAPETSSARPPARRNSVTQTDRVSVNGTPKLLRRVTEPMPVAQLSTSLQHYFKYTCSEPGCNKKYPHRANLRRHRRSVHGLEDSGASSGGGSFLSAVSSQPADDGAGSDINVRIPSKKRGAPKVIGLPNASILRRGARGASAKKIVHFRSPRESPESEASVAICDVPLSNSTATRPGGDHKRAHSGERPHKCDECSKSFCYLHHLSRHKQIHSGEKPHKCDQCPKTFSHAGHLKDHKRVHGAPLSSTADSEVSENKENKAFVIGNDSTLTKSRINGSAVLAHQCPKCEKAYATSKGLGVHMRKHGIAKVYDCRECGKQFGNIKILKKHEQSHVVNFRCQFCRKDYISQKILDSHIKAEHPSSSESSLGEQETVVEIRAEVQD